MSNNFGLARYGLTRYGGRAVIFSSQALPGFCYVFSIKRKGDSKSVWKCTECHKLKHQNSAAYGAVPLISIECDRILTDPDNPKNGHFCQPEKVESVEAFQIRMEAKDDVKKSGKRPRQAYQEASAKVARRFAHDHSQKQAVQNALPAYSTAKPGLYRAYGSHYPVINTINQIPPRLEMTLEGSTSTDPQDPKYQEPYMLLSQANPPLLIFASPEDLATLHQSEHWVADGTFQYRPTDFPFSQLYIVFAFKNGESLPAVHALLPDKLQATYSLVFSTIRNALLQCYGGVGSLRYGHFDFEGAAISAFLATFTQAAAKGCLFHFAQAVNRNIQAKNLKAVYDRSASQGFNAPQFQPIRTWIRRLVALSILRPDLVFPAWTRLLKVPPMTGTSCVDIATNQFSGYFERQWLHSTDQINLWNHFEHDGPRTNNNAEGYNSSLTAKFRNIHPRLSVFLVKLQEIHHSVQVRSRELANGAAPNSRLQCYVQKDLAISNAKASFQQSVLALNPNDAAFQQQMDLLILNYLDAVALLIGH